MDYETPSFNNRYVRDNAGNRQSRRFGIMLGPMSKEDADLAGRRRVKLFKNGRNQAVRIPREFELPGDEAIMSKEGQRLIIEPARQKSLLAILASLSPLDEDFPPIPELPTNPVEL